MTNVGFGPDVMVPAKGLHTPEQAYVEYTNAGSAASGSKGGGGAALDKDKLMADLRAEMNRLVGVGGASAAVRPGKRDREGLHLTQYALVRFSRICIIYSFIIRNYYESLKEN